MDQKKINNFQDKIFKIAEKDNNKHEFLCALSNVKSLIENKMAAQLLKTQHEAMLKSMISAFDPSR